MSTGATLLANVRLADGGIADLRMAEGVIEAIGPGLEAAGAEVIDGGGLLALPGMIDGHVHLDKTLTGPAVDALPRRPGPGQPHRHRTRPARAVAAAGRAGRESGSQGHRRRHHGVPQHADIGPDIGLRHVEALWRSRPSSPTPPTSRSSPFPQYGVLAAPGTFELMDEALAMGADVVGGIDPIVQDGDLDGQLDLLFKLAEKHGACLDPHIHDPGEPECWKSPPLPSTPVRPVWTAAVTVSHGFCLGACPDDVFERLADAMAEAGCRWSRTAAVRRRCRR